MANTVGAQESSPAQLRQQVEDTERAFAASMAARDYAAFTQAADAQRIAVERGV